MFLPTFAVSGVYTESAGRHWYATSYHPRLAHTGRRARGLDKDFT